MVSMEQFWSLLWVEARRSQNARQNFGTTSAGVLVGGFVVLGSSLLPGLGTLVGLAAGGVLGATIIYHTHKDKTFQRLNALSKEEARILLCAVQQTYPNLDAALATELQESGILRDLIDQVEALRQHKQG